MLLPPQSNDKCLDFFKNLKSFPPEFEPVSPLSYLCRGFEPANKAVLPAEGVEFGLLGSQLVGLIGQEYSWNWPPVIQGHLRREERFYSGYMMAVQAVIPGNLRF